MPTSFLRGYTLNGDTLTEYTVEESAVGGGLFLSRGALAGRVLVERVLVFS